MIKAKISLPSSEYRNYRMQAALSLSTVYGYIEIQVPKLLVEAEIPLPETPGPGLHLLVQEVIQDLIQIAETDDFAITVGYLEFGKESDFIVYKMKHGERFIINIV